MSANMLRINHYFYGTSLEVENFSKGLICLSMSGYYRQVEIRTGKS